MKAYLIRRLFLIIPAFIGISIITFALVQLSPGNPAYLRLQAMQGAMKGYSKFQEMSCGYVDDSINLSHVALAIPREIAHGPGGPKDNTLTNMKLAKPGDSVRINGKQHTVLENKSTERGVEMSVSTEAPPADYEVLPAVRADRLQEGDLVIQALTAARVQHESDE